MNELQLRRAITTGLPQIQTQTRQEKEQATKPAAEFQKVLENSLQQNVTFSKHAAQRVAQRGIELSEHNLARLHEGIRLAETKGLDDTLILVDNMAFLVNVSSNKVITTISSNEMKGNVFTNIDGTVIM